ncbi:lymphoid-specific helicase [Colletotrichum spaethianum]|uniref:Lymphoid-specific helicase n=1 Tax=Colletotrichum spaethianum TaxID=700344 RepID=A0AA37LFX8_9PEZI|nr:lymphoid-specific helicase [Colletotrichum spaethianum]GKT45220.1 lymphoid-specific helicase [Colletotrichum spaethianum]
MDSSATSEVESVMSTNRRLDTSAPSSPPRDDSVEPIDAEFKSIMEEEAKARAANEKKTKAAKKAQNAKNRRKKKNELSKEERQRRARELEGLLARSAAFSDMLVTKTQALGRVGTSLEGETLGDHKLAMASQPKLMTGGEMRDYQLEGLTWMAEICIQGLSGILADEMGLGKTVQTISLIAHTREQNYLGPHLIVAPLSTLSNWMDEFEKWCPEIPVVLFHGDAKQRAKIKREQLDPNIKNGMPTKKFPVVCTSYEMVLRERATLAKFQWAFIIIDEGHRMKNFESKLFQELENFTSATRLLITGTPLQNNLRELWALLHFLMPGIFKDWEAFEEWFNFDDLQDEEGTEEFIADRENQELIKKIHVILQPLLLRRVKADVAAHLPKKREYILFAPMTKEQTDIYNAINDKNVDTRAYLENKVVERLTSTIGAPTKTEVAAVKEMDIPIRSRVTRGRRRYVDSDPDDEDKLSDDEFEAKLAREAEDDDKEDDTIVMSAEEQHRVKILEQAKKEMSAKKLGNPDMQLRLVCNSPHNFFDPWSYEGSPPVDESIVTSSGKMLMLDRLLPVLFTKGHKVLIFSQFKTQLDILQDYCELRKWNACRLDGSVSQESRRDQIKEFNENPAFKIFLLSTRAGGQGINLASADTVILFDSDWNPQQDLQAQDRCHRIGQNRPVIVYRLATKGTVEEELLLSADAKRRLEKLIIKKGSFKTMGQKVNLKEDLDKETLKSLLLKDGQIFKQSGEHEILSDKDLEVLCDRSDEAYSQAAQGTANADGYKVIETTSGGITIAGQDAA